METAVPTLRVMRLQSPELHIPSAGSLSDHCLLHTSLCLPDSLGVYVGEKFTAYLGILNSSKSTPIRKLTVSAQLQSPSARWQLPSNLDHNDIPPNSGVDAIVSHDIEEAGQHILRVEVGYVTAEGASKTFRKFYRFNVVSPLTFRISSVRFGDAKCFVSVTVEFGQQQQQQQQTSSTETLVVAGVEFAPADGLSADPIRGDGLDVCGQQQPEQRSRSSPTAVELFDRCDVLSSGSSCRYLFEITAKSNDAILRGIAAGDLLGRANVTWRKAMGETGRISTAPVYCPPVQADLGADSPGSNFVVHRSGLSVDVAAAAAAAQSRSHLVGSNIPLDANDLSRRLAVTVEPIDPPSRMQLYMARPVQFLLVNHSSQSMTLQVQFRLSSTSTSSPEKMAQSKTAVPGIAICGPSFQTIDHVPPNGGSTVVTAHLMPLAAGLLRVDGCCVVDLVSGQEIPQPPLFQVFVVEKEDDAIEELRGTSSIVSSLA